MICRRRSKNIRILTGVWTLCIILGASFIGVYPAAAADTVSEKLLQKEVFTHDDADSIPVEPQFDGNGLNGVTDGSNVPEDVIPAESNMPLTGSQ